MIMLGGLLLVNCLVVSQLTQNCDIYARILCLAGAWTWSPICLKSPSSLEPLEPQEPLCPRDPFSYCFDPNKRILSDCLFREPRGLICNGSRMGLGAQAPKELTLTWSLGA